MNNNKNNEYERNASFEEGSEVRFDSYLDSFYQEHASQINDIDHNENEKRAAQNMASLKNKLYPTPAVKRARMRKVTVRALALAAALVLVILPVMLFSGVIPIPGFNTGSGSSAAGTMENAANDATDQISDMQEASTESSEPADMPEAPAESSSAPAESSEPAQTEPKGDPSYPIVGSQASAATIDDLIADKTYGAYVPPLAPDGFELSFAQISDENGHTLNLSYQSGNGYIDIVITSAMDTADADIFASELDALTKASLKETLQQKESTGTLTVACINADVSMTVCYSGIQPEALAEYISSADGWFNK